MASGAETSLRRKAEGLLLMAVLRCIEAALESAVDRGKGAGQIVESSCLKNVFCDVNLLMQMRLTCRKGMRHPRKTGAVPVRRPPEGSLAHRRLSSRGLRTAGPCHWPTERAF